VGDGAFWSEWNQFTTASTERKPVKFVYVGDAQNDIFSLWSRLIRTGFRKAPDAQFIVHAGDLVNRASRDAEWGEWFQAAGWINRTTPSLPSPGNHEYVRENDGPRGLTSSWRPQFELAANGPEGLEETCYYVDIQGLRFVSLNSNEKREAQAAWLDRILSNNPNRWTILAFHHPIYSAARSRDNKELRELWEPVIHKHKVDLVLQGHDHSYARSNLMTGVNAQSDDGATVYVVSVSGPKMYDLNAASLTPWMAHMARVAEDTQLFQVIEVNGDRLSYESHTARGRLYDAFDLRKRDGAPNELINRIPETPERRRGDS
jgi:3',5'-cyclic AMP phosphodiesterase CpdA